MQINQYPWKIRINFSYVIYWSWISSHVFTVTVLEPEVIHTVVIVDNNPSSSLFIFNCTNKMTPTTQKALWDTDISTLNVGNFGNSIAFLQLIQLSKYTPSDHCCGHSENKTHMRDSVRVMFRCWTLLPLEIKIRRMFWNKFGPGGWWEKINVLHATAKTKMALQTRQDINFQGIFKKLGAESFFWHLQIFICKIYTCKFLMLIFSIVIK